MANKTLIPILILIILCSCKKASEVKKYESDLKKIEQEAQKKLDTGISMLQTSRDYQSQTDSMLKLIIEDYSNLLENDEKEKFDLEQKEWLKNKESVSDSLWNEVDIIFNETGISPELERMVAYGEIADINYKRALEINRRIQKTKE